MTVLGRDISRYTWRRIPEIPVYLGYFLKCFWLFRNPIPFILAYLRSQTMPGGIVTLRNGLTIHLAGHPHDVITVFIIFVREDYGRIQPGTTVVDIGANIGIFSLYAAHRGKAARVYAFEPNSESYACLLRNVRANALERTIIPGRFAVVGSVGGPVRFPTRSSMYNAIITDQAGDDYEWVDTTTLPQILAQAGEVGLVKLDCEGAEYDILFSAGEEEFGRIANLRLEYHANREQEIVGHLTRHGYTQYHAVADTPSTGNMWFGKASA